MQINGFNPTHGPVGAQVTIQLSDMPPDAAGDNTTAFLNTTPLAVDAVAVNPNGTGTVDVTITQGAQTSGFLVVAGAQFVNAQSAGNFAVDPPPVGPPRVTSMVPDTAAVGTFVLLSGQHLDRVTAIVVGPVTVMLFITHSAAQLRFRVPQMLPGTYRVYLRTALMTAPLPFSLTVTA